MADYAILRTSEVMRPPSWLQTRNGWLWGAVICLVTCDIVLRVVVKDEATSSAYARDFVTSQPGSDSWRPMALAIERLRSSPRHPVYSRGRGCSRGSMPRRGSRYG